MKRQELQIQVPCPICKLGKYPSGARCSTCEGEGWVLTLLGVEIAALIDDRIQRKYGKSPVDTVAKLEVKAPGGQAKEVVKGQPVSSPAPVVPHGTPEVQSRGLQVRRNGNSPQTGTWTLP